MMRTIFVSLFIVFQLFLSFESAAATTGRVKVTGIYSDLAFHEQSGDVLGNEAIIVFSRKGYFVVFQSSEGDPSAPVVAPAKISNQNITFTLPAPMDEWGQFTGQISSEGLTGKFQSSGQELHLKRKNSYWQ